MTKIHKISKGLDIKLLGDIPPIINPYHNTLFSISPDDFKWLTPQLIVAEGELVKVGTPLFTAKENPDIRIVSPVSGKISGIIRGEKRKIQSINIESDTLFSSVEIALKNNSDKNDIINSLLQYGIWPLIRQRPFNIIAAPDSSPKSIFIPCFDSAPLAPDYDFIINQYFDEFTKGLEVISSLTKGKTYLCARESQQKLEEINNPNIEVHYFKGPHPSGNVGTHIHHIDPINKGEVIWHVNPQTLITIGRLFLYQKLDFTKVVAFTGCEKEVNGYRELINGVVLDEVLEDYSLLDQVRLISGNILTGKNITEHPAIGYYDAQVTLLKEGGERELFGWLLPGFKKWSFSHTFTSWWFKNRPFKQDTSLHGGMRPFIMTGVYEKVFPFDIFPMQLMKACIIKDVDLMEELGIYEVVEEDFALCEVVCPSKTECQQIISDGLLLLKS